MSTTKVTHTMTVTETTTTPPSKLAFNIQVLKRKDAVLKFFETLIGLICMGMIFKGELAHVPENAAFPLAVFCLCVMACVLPTFLLLVSYLMSPMAASMLPKMIFEVLNNVVASVFYITTSMAFLIIMSKKHDEYPVYEAPIAVAVLGLVNAILYFLSTYLSFQTFRSP